ncbi:hypothetical protein D869_gp050 [Caulobacter phage CcrRogue]|uniref:Uncharacterized protein n=1 Tax=Caulobacter phage CcrRogue TaxID=2927986 RepID=K4K2W3_9CAUD|nr:hypothetical protein D869_gp050 [Caulobacter phage CcrRogue]AFU86532.1 hypothetical protein CcrRogue_gp050 [Caulobacter phage CcrRogue]
MSDDFDKQFDDKVRARDAAAVDEQLRLALPEPGVSSKTVAELIQRIALGQSGEVIFEVNDPPYEAEVEQAVEIETAQRRDGKPDAVFTEQDYLDQSVDKCAAKFLDTPLGGLPFKPTPDGKGYVYARELAGQAAPKITISVYLNNGTVREYDVADAATAREHAFEIIQTGYRSVDQDAPNVLVHWPPHEIKKVKLTASEPLKTTYFDRVRGT